MNGEAGQAVPGLAVCVISVSSGALEHARRLPPGLGGLGEINNGHPEHECLMEVVGHVH